MRKYVLDTYSLLAYSEKEDGYDKVADLLAKSLFGEINIFLCVVNWGEMYYIALRKGGESNAELHRETFEKYPIDIIDATKELTLQAARFKASHKMSYADAYAAALAKLNKAELVTGDKEFKELEKEIKILWIRLQH